MRQVEPGAWIDGRAAGVDDALAVAAALLSESRQPLLAGLGTDVQGTRAAVFLAERIGGVLDHIHSGPMLRDLDVVRETGAMLTTPGEVRVRADTLLLVGDGLVEAWPALKDVLALQTRGDDGRRPRRVIWLAPEDAGELRDGPGPFDRLTIGSGPNRAALIATLRARVKARPVAMTAPLAEIDAIAETLRASRFGVAVWRAGELDAMELEMVNGLVRDLNETTRFSTLSLPPADNGAGVLATCGWMTGFPVRTGFGRHGPEHDPWRFDSHRLIAQAETDCIVWISAFGAPAPAEWPAPAIAIAEPRTRFARQPKVRIAVGRPGRDHAAILHEPDVGTLTSVPASAPSETPSVGQILSRLADRLPARAPTP